MAEETELFNPLDSLGPEFGKNRPILDTQGLSPFEGKMPRPQAINFPDVYYPAYPQPKADLPNVAIRDNVVGNPPNAPGPSAKASPKDFGDSYEAYINSLYQANQDKNVYSKIYSYDAGPSGNAFYKRYAAYGQETFDKVGFHPLKNNEANFNAATTWWDDANRMLTHSFVPLLKNGFWSGPKSLGKMLQGDFTSADLEDARMYEEAAAIGQSSKGGFGSFFNNTLMNFGYTAGIIGEAVVEEVAGAVLAPVTGGASFAFATANNVNKASKIFRGFGMVTDGAKALRQSLKTFSNLPEARKFWEAADAGLKSKLGRTLNPLENTMDALGGLSKADNLTNLAKLSKTAGGFYRDVRNLNMALSEARLEAGMTENKVFDDLYNKHYDATGVAPTDKDEYEFKKQAKEASLSTLYLNTGLIYLSNKITFDSITSPRGGVRNYLKSVTDDIAKYESGKFGNLGKVIYDKSKKAFAFEKNNLKNLAKSWYRDPLSKSALGTVKYFKANFSEGIQENLQEVIAGANERYYIDTFGSDARSSYEYSKAAIKDGLARQKGDYFREELGKQFSGQGLETFASGFLMGTFAAPLNSAIPFLSVQYNRIFDKAAYTKWKTDKENIATNLVKQLNDVKVGEFLSDRIYNLGAQDIAAQIKRTGTKKEALDAENQAFVDSVSFMMDTNTIDQFKDKLGSFKEMTDEEFVDAMGGIAQEDIAKYRSRIDQSMQKLDSVKAKKQSYTNKFPNPIDAMSLDENDPDYYNKAVTYHAWNKAVNNAVYFSETFEDVKSRMADIKVKYAQRKGFNVVNSTDAVAIFKPDALINQVGIFETELAGERASIKPNAKRIKALEDKIASLQSYSEAYESFNRFFSRGQYAGEIIAELKKELGSEPTQEQIIERMDQKLGSATDENLALPYIKALRDSHHKYLKTLGIEQDEILFDEDLDAGFEELLDFYKLNDEYKEVAKYVETLNNPENFLDLVQKNSEWMDKLYHNREEYYTKMILDQITKVEMNSLLNALADKGYFISAEDFENYVAEGTPPTEIFYAVTNKVYKRGTEEYNQVYREYFVKMAELRETVTKTKSEFVNKDYQSKMDKLDADMKAEIDALPKDAETGMPDPKEVEKITNKYNKEKQRVEEQFKKDKAAAADEEKTDYTFTFEGKTINTKDKSIKDLRVYQDLLTDRIKALQESKDMSEDAEEKKELTAQIKKFNLEIANIEKIIDAMTLKGYTAEQKKSIKAIQNLIKQQEGVEEGYMLTEDDPTTGLKKGDIAYRIKGLIHRRVTNAIRDIESKDYKYKSAPNIDEAFNETIGKDGLNKKSVMNFMAQLRVKNEKGEPLLAGFNDELYDELEQFVESLEGKTKAQIEQELYIDKIKKNLNKLDEKIAAAYADDNSKRAALLTKQKQDLETELEQVTGQTVTTGSEEQKADIERRRAEDIKNRNKDSKTISLSEIRQIWTSQLESDSIYSRISELLQLFRKDANKRFILEGEEGYEELISLGVKPSREGYISYDDAIIGLENRTNKLKSDAQEKVKQQGLKIITDDARKESDTKLFKEINAKYDAELAALDTEVSTPDTTLDLIQKFAAEKSYEDGRTVGNFVDDAKDYFEKGVKPEFDEKLITRDAYDNLFGENGYLTELKRKVDSREVYIVGRGLVVYDSDITKPDGSTDRIAGEIDLIMADRKGNIFIVDLKTGTETKWNNFNKVNRALNAKTKYFSKRENYTLQQGAYARMLENMIGVKAGVALLPIQRVTNADTNQILKAGKPSSENIYKKLIFSKDDEGNYLITEAGEIDYEVDESDTKSSMFIPLYPDAYKDKLDQILPPKTNQIRLNWDDIEGPSGESFEDMSEVPTESPTAKPTTPKASAYENIITKYRNTEEAAKKTIEDLKASLVPLTNTVSFANIDLDDNSPFIIEELKKDQAFAERYAFHERIAESTSSPTSGQEEAVDILKQSGIVTAAEVNDLAPTMGDYSELIHEAVKRIQYLKTQSTDNAEIKELSDYQRQIFTLMGNTKFLTETQNFINTIESINFEASNGRPRTAIKQANQVINELTAKERAPYTRTDEKKRLQIKIDDLKLLRDDIIAKEGLEDKLDDPTTVANLTKEISTATDIEKARKLLNEAISDDLIITSEGINYLNSLLVQREQEIANNELPIMNETNIQKGDIYEAKTNIFTTEKQKKPYIKVGGKVRIVSYNTEDNTVTLVKDGGIRPKPYTIGLDQFNEQYMLKDVLDGSSDNATSYKPTKDEKDLAKYSTEVLNDFLKNDRKGMDDAKAAAEKQSVEEIDKELFKNLNCK
jgi:hypothetical protein